MAKIILVILKQLIHERERKPPDAPCADEEMASTNQPIPNEQVFLSPSPALARELALLCLSFPLLHGNKVWVSLWRNVGKNKWLQGCKGPEDCRWEASLKGDKSNDKILSMAKS